MPPGTAYTRSFFQHADIVYALLTQLYRSTYTAKPGPQNKNVKWCRFVVRWCVHQSGGNDKSQRLQLQAGVLDVDCAFLYAKTQVLQFLFPDGRVYLT